MVLPNPVTISLAGVTTGSRWRIERNDPDRIKSIRRCAGSKNGVDHRNIQLALRTGIRSEFATRAHGLRQSGAKETVNILLAVQMRMTANAPFASIIYGRKETFVW
jgi:hypothetical protein